MAEDWLLEEAKSRGLAVEEEDDWLTKEAAARGLSVPKIAKSKQSRRADFAEKASKQGVKLKVGPGGEIQIDEDPTQPDFREQLFDAQVPLSSAFASGNPGMIAESPGLADKTFSPAAAAFGAVRAVAPTAVAGAVGLATGGMSLPVSIAAALTSAYLTAKGQQKAKEALFAKAAELEKELAEKNPGSTLAGELALLPAAFRTTLPKTVAEFVGKAALGGAAGAAAPIAFEQRLPTWEEVAIPALTAPFLGAPRGKEPTRYSSVEDILNGGGEYPPPPPSPWNPRSPSGKGPHAGRTEITPEQAMAAEALRAASQADEIPKSTVQKDPIPYDRAKAIEEYMALDAKQKADHLTKREHLKKQRLESALNRNWPDVSLEQQGADGPVPWPLPAPGEALGPLAMIEAPNPSTSAALRAARLRKLTETSLPQGEPLEDYPRRGQKTRADLTKAGNKMPRTKAEKQQAAIDEAAAAIPDQQEAVQMPPMEEQNVALPEGFQLPEPTAVPANTDKFNNVSDADLVDYAEQGGWKGEEALKQRQEATKITPEKELQALLKDSLRRNEKAQDEGFSSREDEQAHLEHLTKSMARLTELENAIAAKRNPYSRTPIEKVIADAEKGVGKAKEMLQERADEAARVAGFREKFNSIFPDVKGPLNPNAGVDPTILKFDNSPYGKALRAQFKRDAVRTIADAEKVIKDKFPTMTAASVRAVASHMLSPASMAPASVAEGKDHWERLGNALDSASKHKGKAADFEFQEKVRRAEVADSILKKAAASGSDMAAAQKKAQAALDGKLPKADYKLDGPGIDPKDVQKMFSDIFNNADLDALQKERSAKSLRRVLGADEHAPTQEDINRLRRAFGDKIPLTGWSKTWANVGRGLNVPREALAGVDMSAPLRQNLVLTISHPSIAAKAGIDMVRAYGSELFKSGEFTKIIDERLANSTNAEVWRAAKLEIVSRNAKRMQHREEPFQSGILEKLPGVGRLWKASNAAYTSYGNLMRTQVFDSVYNQMKEVGGVTHKEATALADFINSASGRGSFGEGFNRAAPILNAGVFSARLMASRLKLLNPAGYWNPVNGGMPPRVRAYAIKSMAKTVGAGLAIMGLAKLNGARVEVNPLSSEFGKICHGRVCIATWGGMNQYVRFIAQEMMNKYKDKRGDIRHFNPDLPYGRTRLSTIGSFARGKAAPVVGVAIDALSGKDMRGKDFDPLSAEYLADKSMPIFLQDVYDVSKTEGLAFGSAVTAFSFLGGDVQTYDNPIEDLEIKARESGELDEDAAQELIDTKKATRRQIRNLKHRLSQDDRVVRVNSMSIEDAQTMLKNASEEDKQFIEPLVEAKELRSEKKELEDKKGGDKNFSPADQARIREIQARLLYLKSQVDSLDALAVMAQ